eukprot:8821404-Pyramimonas_sp.AAC.1
MSACVPLARKVTIEVVVAVVVVVSTSSSSCRRRRRGEQSYAHCPLGVSLAITFHAMRTEVHRAERT